MMEGGIFQFSKELPQRKIDDNKTSKRLLIYPKDGSNLSQSLFFCPGANINGYTFLLFIFIL